MGDSYRLPGIVLEASSSKTWDIAVSEWHVVGCHDNGNTSGECLCGHEGIRYEFTIKNSVNGKELSPIGSTCILKFENDELKNEVEGWKAAIKLLEALEARKPGVRLDGMNRDLFSRRLYAFLYDVSANLKLTTWDCGGNPGPNRNRKEAACTALSRERSR